MAQETETTEAERFFLRRAHRSHEWDEVPPHTQKALLAYLRREYRPGPFLTAVLTNNLAETVFRADELNLPALKPIMICVWNYMPSQSWGSEEAIQSWLEGES